MKPDYPIAELTSDSLGDAVGKTVRQQECPYPAANSEVIQIRSGGLIIWFGWRLARHVDPRFLTLGDLEINMPLAVDIPLLNLNEHRILHDFFQQKTGLESCYEGDSRFVLLQMRG